MLGTDISFYHINLGVQIEISKAVRPASFAELLLPCSKIKKSLPSPSSKFISSRNFSFIYYIFIQVLGIFKGPHLTG